MGPLKGELKGNSAYVGLKQDLKILSPIRDPGRDDLSTFPLIKPLSRYHFYSVLQEAAVKGSIGVFNLKVVSSLLLPNDFSVRR